MSKLRVFVTGIDHSGTSAVAGMLHHLGVVMIEEGHDMCHHHRYPLYEQRDIQAANEAIGGEKTAPWEAIIKRRRELPIWGAKDPRFCYVFERVVPLLDGPFRLITTWRDPEAVVASWKRNKRTHFDEIKNKQKALPALDRFTPMLVVYEDLVRDPYAVATQLDLELGLDRPEAVIKTAAQFVSEYKS